jgi:hypothetical protein
MLAAVTLAAVLIGCVTTATTPSHNLDIDAVRRLRLERLDLALSPDARVHWPSLADAPVDALRAHAISKLREKALVILEPSLRSALAGTRPVAARMTVSNVYVPTAMELLGPGLLLGADAMRSRMRARLDLLDARSGAVVLSFPETFVSTQGGYKPNLGTSGSLSHDPIERLMTDYHAKLSAWLLRG